MTLPILEKDKSITFANLEAQYIYQDSKLLIRYVNTSYEIRRPRRLSQSRRSFDFGQSRLAVNQSAVSTPTPPTTQHPTALASQLPTQQVMLCI